MTRFYLSSLCLALLLLSPHTAGATPYANRHQAGNMPPQKITRHIPTESEEVTSSFSSKIKALIAEYNAKDNESYIIDSDSILGHAVATPEQCVRYLLENNPRPDISVSPSQLVDYYYEEGNREGVRPDVAFAQAIVETGFFRYGGTVSPAQNNYCGLGTTSAVVKGAHFSSSLLGVRAHIQHLLAYASTRSPREAIVDPRYHLVRNAYGTRYLRTWQDLNGKWAVPGRTYGQNILRVYEGILNTK